MTTSTSNGGIRETYMAQASDEATARKIQTLVIPHELPTMNEMIDAQARSITVRGKRISGYSNMKKAATRQVAWLARAMLNPVEDYPIDLGLHWVRKNRRSDKDNVAAGIKFVLDGLIEGGIIENDGWKHINNWVNSFDADPDDQQVIVTIYEGVTNGA